MRKFLATVLFVCLGLPIAFSSLLLISIRPWALDRQTYKRFVEDDRLYAALQAPEIAARAPETIAIGNGSFEGPALVAAAQKELPLPAIKATASRAVDSVMDAVLGNGRVESATVDMRPLKAALRNRSPAIARDYAAALSGTRPKPGVIAQSASADKALTLAINGIPDLARAPAPPAVQARRLSGPAAGVLSRGLSQALLNRMTATMAAISALLIAGLGALGGSGALSRLSRAGRYLLLPSVLVLGIGAILAIPGGLFLQNLLPHGVRGLTGGPGGALFRDFLASALGPIARSIFVTGLVGASLGGVLSQAERIAGPKELE